MKGLVTSDNHCNIVTLIYLLAYLLHTNLLSSMPLKDFLKSVNIFDEVMTQTP